MFWTTLQHTQLITPGLTYIFAIFGTGFLRDAGPTVVPATEPIVGLNSRGGWNEYGANAGTRRHRDALVGKAQTATGTALGMGQTLQGGSNIMKRRGKISLLNAKPNTKGEVRKLLLDYRETKKKNSV